MTTIERLEKFHSYLKEKGYGGRNVFERQIGKKEGYMTNALKKNTSISSDVLEKVMNAFPEVNIEWLISGKGKMIKEENEDKIPNLPELEYWKSMAKSAQEMYEDEVKKVVELRLEMISLKAKLEEKQKTA